MKPGENRKTRQGDRETRRQGDRALPISPPPRLLVSLSPCLLVWLLAGCSAARPHVDRDLMADKHTHPRGVGVAGQYVLGCPDVIEVTVAGRPELSDRGAVGPDGRADLPALGRPRVDGLPVAQAEGLLARQAGVPPGDVRVR